MRRAVATVSLLAMVAGGCAASAPAATESASQRFLATYVTNDGRVIRYDQGDDIVSEGQAYGVLIAEIAGDTDLARRVWSWTRTHLSLPNGLLAWHADEKGVPDSNQSAADADSLMAFGLLRYAGPDASSLHRDGRALAAAVLKNEAVTVKGDVPIVVAGPWAVAQSVVDPSYLMPAVFNALGRLTGNRAWSAAATEAVRLVSGLTNGGQQLPPDWAALHEGGLVATPAPGTSGTPEYGFDAVRLPLWFASSCDSSARQLAAAWWTNVFSKQREPGALPLTLSGDSLNAATNPVQLMAAAAAAAAAGHHSRSTALIARATALAQNEPSYYGDAWVAIGDALSHGGLDACAP